MMAFIFLIGLLAGFQMPLGTITGRVINDHNEPIAGIAVQLLHKGYNAEGIPEIRVVQIALTNTQGEYRLFGIPPSQYYLRTDNVSASNEAYRTLYYAGATDETTAVPLQVPSGTELTNINFVVSKARFVNIRGWMTDAIHLPQPYIGWILLFSRESFALLQKTTCNKDGSFEFHDVAPGSYYVVGRRIDDAPNRVDAVVPLEVRDTDIQDVELMSAKGFEIRGRVRIDRRPVQGVRVSLRPVADLRSPISIEATAKPDGTFSIPNLPSGNYRLFITGVSEPYYVQSGTLGGTNVVDNEVSITDTISDELVIVMSSNGGQIHGNVLDADDKPVNRSFVVLVPEGSRRNRPDLYKMLQTDPYGRFTFRGIAPGDYQIYAWDHVEPRAYYDTDFMKRFEDRGWRVRIREGDSLSAQLTQIQVEN